MPSLSAIRSSGGPIISSHPVRPPVSPLLATLSTERIKTFCGAQPMQKVRWIERGRGWVGLMEFSVADLRVEVWSAA